MSMHVILDRVPNAADWQAAITAAGFNLVLDPSLNTDTNNGYLPVRFDDLDSGFEFSVASVLDSAPTFLPFVKPNDTRKLSANFTWGGDILEMCCAFAAASALAKLSEVYCFNPRMALGVLVTKLSRQPKQRLLPQMECIDAPRPAE